MKHHVTKRNWLIVDAEKRHKENPNTFHIPPRKERKSVKAGDLVKLIFEPLQPSQIVSGERNWVIVKKRKGSRYVGTLDDDFLVLDVNLYKGDEFEFEAKNIIAIWND